MIINIKIPFNYVQVKVYTKSTELLNPIEFLWMNLVNSKNKNEIPKDKRLKECFKEYYNIDDKFFSFLIKYLKKLINNDSIAIKHLKKDDKLFNRYDQLFIGDLELNESLINNFNNKQYLSFQEGEGSKNTYSCHNYFSIFSKGLGSIDIKNDELEEKKVEWISFESLNIDNDINNKNIAISNSKLFISRNKLRKNENILDAELTSSDKYCLIDFPIDISIDNDFNCVYNNVDSRVVLISICNNEFNFMQKNFIESIYRHFENSFKYDFRNKYCEDLNDIVHDQEVIKNLIYNNKLINDIFGNDGNFTFYDDKMCFFGIKEKEIKISILDKKYLVSNIPFVFVSNSFENYKIKEKFNDKLLNSLNDNSFNWDSFIKNKEKFLFLEKTLKNIFIKMVENNDIKYFENNPISLDYLSNDIYFIQLFYKSINYEKLYLNFDIKNRFKDKFFIEIFKLDKNEKKFLKDIEKNTINNLEFEEFIWKNYNYEFDINNKLSNFEFWNFAYKIYCELDKFNKDILYINQNEFDNYNNFYGISKINLLEKEINKLLDRRINMKQLKEKFYELNDNINKISDILDTRINDLALKVRKEIECFFEENFGFNFQKNNFSNFLDNLKLDDDLKKMIKDLKKFSNYYMHYNDKSKIYSYDEKIKLFNENKKKYKDLKQNIEKWKNKDK